MPDGQVAPAGGGNAAQNQQQGGGVDMWSVMKQFAFRLFIIYMISSFIRNWRQPTGPQGNETAPAGPPPQAGRNMFAKMTPLDVYAYISEKGCGRDDGGPFDDFNNTESLFWSLTDI